MRIKRGICLAVLLSLCMGSWGCSDSQNVYEETESIQKKVILEVYAWPDEEQNVKLLAEAYMKKQPGVTIHINLVPISEYNQKMLALKNSEIKVDCIFCSNISAAMVWQNKGMLHNLDVWRNPEAEKNYDTWYQAGEEICASYMMPYRVSRWAVYYNKSMFDEAGIDYPEEGWTWEDYRKTAILLSGMKNGVRQYGSLSFEPSSTWWRVPARTMGANDPMKEEDLEAFRKSAEWIYHLTYEDHAQIPYEEQTGSSGADYDAVFLQGNIGMYFSGDWSATRLNQEKQEGKMDFEYDIAGMPRMEGEESWVISDAAVITMTANTEYPAEAYDFMSFVSGEEGAEVLAENNVIPAWNTENVRKLYLQSSDMPEHLENFFKEGPISAVPCNAKYTESMEIVKTEVSLYLLKEQSLEQTFGNIESELREIK